MRVRVCGGGFLFGDTVSACSCSLRQPSRAQPSRLLLLLRLLFLLFLLLLWTLVLWWHLHPAGTAALIPALLHVNVSRCVLFGEV